MGAWTVSGESILPAGRRTRALLAVIALAGPRPISRGWLASLFWNRRAQGTGRTPLSLEARSLAEALAPADATLLIATRDHLSFRPGTVWTDAWEVMRATADQPSSLSLLDGELLDGLDGISRAFDIWLKQERERLRDRARDVAETILLARREPDSVILAARRLLLIDPVHEGSWRALMSAYAERGEHQIALRAYERCRTLLSDRLDAVPSADTQALQAEIRHRMAARPDNPVPQRPRETGFAAADGTPHAGGQRSRTWPHVGVPPMRCIALSPRESFLGVSLAHEISLALSRFYRVTVAAPDALARFAGNPGDEAAMRRTFGIDYLLDGTIQRERDNLRVSLRLFDLRADNLIVWAERFDRAGHDPRAAQTEIAAEAVARVEPELQLIESLRGPPRPPAELTANNLLHLTAPAMTRMDREGFMGAAQYFERAVAQEPDFCDAHAWYAFWHVLLVSQGWSAEPRQALNRGRELADRAVALNPSAVRALTIAGLVRAQQGRPPAESAAFYDRALELNPNLAMTWAMSAVTCANLGDIDEAERRYGTYKMLSPRHRLAFIFDAFFAPINVIKRDYRAAISMGHTLMQLNPAFSAGYKPHLAALGHLGRHQEAASVLRRLLAIEPNFTKERFLQTTLMSCKEDREHFVEGLTLAGVQ
jgi:DNA-binding SARP family transcriptional activator/TolB-like protein